MTVPGLKVSRFGLTPPNNHGKRAVGERVFLGSQYMDSVTGAAFVKGITEDFDRYVMELVGVWAATGIVLAATVSTTRGHDWLANSYNGNYTSFSATTVTGGASPSQYFPIGMTANNTNHVSGEVEFSLYSLAGTWWVQQRGEVVSEGTKPTVSGGVRNTGVRCNGLRIGAGGAGSLFGTVNLYGIVKP